MTPGSSSSWWDSTLRKSTRNLSRAQSSYDNLTPSDFDDESPDPQNLLVDPDYVPVFCDICGETYVEFSGYSCDSCLKSRGQKANDDLHRS